MPGTSPLLPEIETQKHTAVGNKIVFWAKQFSTLVLQAGRNLLAESPCARLLYSIDS